MKRLLFSFFFFFLFCEGEAQLNQFYVTPDGNQFLIKGSKLTLPSVASASYQWVKNPSWQLSEGLGQAFVGFGESPTNVQDAATSAKGLSYIINTNNVVWTYDTTYKMWINLGNPTQNSIILSGISLTYDNSRLATNKKGQLFVAMVNSSLSDIEVYRYDSSYSDINTSFWVNAWTKMGSAVGNTSDVQFFDLSVSPDGILYVMTIKNSQYQVMKFNGSDWEMVGTNNLDGVFSSNIQTQSSSIFIEFDPTGTPFVIAWDSNVSSFKMAKFNGAAWVQEGANGCGVQSGFDVANFVVGRYGEVFISSYKLDLFATNGPIALIDIIRYTGGNTQNYYKLNSPVQAGYLASNPYLVKDGSRFPYLAYTYQDENSMGIATKRLFYDALNEEMKWQEAFHSTIELSGTGASFLYTKSFVFDSVGLPNIILGDFFGNLTPFIYSFKGDVSASELPENLLLENGRYYGIVRKGDELVWSLNNANVVLCSPTSSDTTITSCGSYSWNGTTYIESGTYVWTGKNDGGCDSTATLHLAINHTSSSLAVGLDFQGGKIGYILKPGEAGYDSSKIKGIILGPVQYGRPWAIGEAQTTLQSITTNGFGFGAANTAALVNKLGTGNYMAYSIDTANYGGYSDWYMGTIGELYTIFSANFRTLYDYIGGGQYIGSGDEYNASQVLGWSRQGYAYINKNSQIQYAMPMRNFELNRVFTESSTTQTACGSFNWNGQTYTASGDYTWLGLNEAGCDSIATLHLTINQPTASADTVTVCESYTWKGQTYTNSGIYTWVGTNTAGCDSTVTLYLTITYNKKNLVIGSSLQGGKIAYILKPDDFGYDATKIKGLIVGTPSVTKTWTINGIEDNVVTSADFGEGPTNTANIISLLGAGDYAAYYCDTLTYGGYDDWYLPSTNEMKLLFTDRVAAGVAETLHTTSTQSGLLFGETTYLFRNLVAPDKSIIESDRKTSSQLVRPIRSFSVDTCIVTCLPNASDTTVAVCSSYSWNGQTLTSSGIYVDTLVNTGGCDSIVTLHLTITPKLAWYRDSDGDGYGNPSDSTLECTQPTGYVANNRDCSDAAPKIGPKFWYKDKDRDGHGSKNQEDKRESCSKPQSLGVTIEEYVEQDDDCDDTNPLIGNTVWYKDADSDGYGTGDSIYVCDQPTGYRLLKDMIAKSGDCDDNNASVYAGSGAPSGIMSSDSDSTICKGEYVTLTAIGVFPSNLTLKWYKDGCGLGSSIGSGKYIKVSPTVTTTYFVRVFGGPCGVSNCTSITVKVKTVPGTLGSITGQSTGLCKATGVNYSVASVANADSYVWSVYNQAAIVSGQGSNAVIVNFGTPSAFRSDSYNSEAGSVIVVKAVNSCGSNSKSLAIDTKAQLTGSISGPSSLKKSTTGVFSVTPAFGAKTYKWSITSPGWSIVSGNGTATVTVKAGTSTGTLRVAASNDCGDGTSISKSINATNSNETTETGLAVDPSTANQLRVWPVPASQVIHLEAGSLAVKRVELLDAIGRTLISGEYVKTLDVSRYPSGSYTVRVVTEKGVEVKKIQIIR